RQIGQASMLAKRLNSAALPSITGSAAYGPTLPRPSTADPSVTTATLLRLMVRRRASSGLAARARLTRATPGVYAIDRSSRLRSGTFERISILPPRCRRNVRSLTLCTETPGIAAIAATSDSACAVSVAAQVTSTRSIPRLPELTSSAVTTPPACSTARVISLTARPCDATSSRAVIEYDTLGAMVMPLPPFLQRHCSSGDTAGKQAKNIEVRLAPRTLHAWRGIQR